MNMNKAIPLFITLLLVGAFTAKASDDPPASMDAPVLLDRSALLTPSTELTPEVMESLTNYDLKDMPRTWWRNLERVKDAKLNSSDCEKQELALRNLAFLATVYPDQKRFDRVIGDLYTMYRFDDNPNKRIMALSALHAIGHEDTMRTIAQDVRFERDERVRKLTVAALADHWGLDR